MQRQPVNSSNIASIGYDESSQILEVEFKSGGIYQYFNVPKNAYEIFMNAGSKGKYFYKYIKERYEFVKIR